MSKYDDIINLPHHVSAVHKPMSMENRAAQFAPFAALSGHEEAISEAARLTAGKPELSEEELYRLSRRIYYAIGKDLDIVITYFIHDEHKEGGKFEVIHGKIKKIDEYEGKLFLTDLCSISLDCIIGIESLAFEEAGL